MYAGAGYIPEVFDDLLIFSFWLAGLRNMKIVLDITSVFPHQRRKCVLEGTLFLSKVTGLLVLKRMPQLTIHLKVPSEAAECEYQYISCGSL